MGAAFPPGCTREEGPEAFSPRKEQRNILEASHGNLGSPSFPRPVFSPILEQRVSGTLGVMGKACLLLT